MFRIRVVPDTATPANAASVLQVQSIFREQFPGIEEAEISALPAKLRDPFKLRFRPVLLVAEDANEKVRGFALVLHAPDLRFCYLDFVAAGGAGRGVGGALYDRVREEASALGAVGLFFECLPDDPALSPDAEICAQNASRLAFYERYGAYPIEGTAYETPVTAGDADPPYLVFDGLGHAELPATEVVRPIVRAILERKYADHCPPEYIDRVVDSFEGERITLRKPRYRRRPVRRTVAPTRDRIVLVVNDRHDIHHVRERGYVEAPVRIKSILRALEPTGLFLSRGVRRFSDEHIARVHSGQLIDYLRRACAAVGDGQSVYPYVFPVRNAARPPESLPLRAGYFCIDTFTPINGNAWRAARRAVDCALTCAESIVAGQRLAYALVRPPGHHAERRAFGGFCYFNNAAVAAEYLSRYGSVAVLDIDYHHGNGTQEIFYERADVLTVSIHGHPRFAYPYFSGFPGEEGAGSGSGFNLNIALPEAATPEQYRAALARALRRVERFAPSFLVVAAGFDTAAGDPTGSWSNRTADFDAIGTAIGQLGLPTLVVQEGGYRVRTLGANVRHFFESLHAARMSAPGPRPARPRPAEGRLAWRSRVGTSDAERVRALTAATGVFSTEESEMAAELVLERVQSGRKSGYYFELVEQGERLLGYACYGPIPGTERRFDLYWIAVDPSAYGRGLGRQILERVEAAAARAGAAWLWVDTSGREAYAPAWRLYRDCGYDEVARLPEFFGPGDAKLIFAKALAPHAQGADENAA